MECSLDLFLGFDFKLERICSAPSLERLDWLLGAAGSSLRKIWFHPWLHREQSHHDHDVSHLSFVLFSVLLDLLLVPLPSHPLLSRVESWPTISFRRYSLLYCIILLWYMPLKESPDDAEEVGDRRRERRLRYITCLSRTNNIQREVVKLSYVSSFSCSHLPKEMYRANKSI